MSTPFDLIERLSSWPGFLASLVESVPARDLKRRPAPNKWSAHEHACHLAVMEPMWQARAKRIVTEDNPEIISYEPDDDDPDRLLGMDLKTALDQFAMDRARLVGGLRSLPASAWDRPARHTSHARYSLFLMCRHIVLHDSLHGYRIEESALGSHWPTEK